MSFASAESLFLATFGAAPVGLAEAPGRVNLVGEHTDYNAGLVLPFAIEAHVTAAFAPRGDDRIRLVSHLHPHVVRGTLDQVPQTGGWSAYPWGVAAALSEYADPERRCGFDMALHSDLPVGAGLSSSAALESAVALILNQLWLCGRDLIELAQAGQWAENEVVGTPTGVMDQVASLLGEADKAVLLDCRDLSFNKLPCAPQNVGLAFMVIDTGVRHDNACGGYGQRREECERAATGLNVDSLREVDASELARVKRALDPKLFRRVRHVVTENARVQEAAAVLRAGELGEIGRVLLASHRSLRDDFEVSSPELDVAVESAMAAGAVGARMTGAGFGGSVIAVVPSGQVSAVVAGVKRAFRNASFREPAIFPVRPSPGAFLLL